MGALIDMRTIYIAMCGAGAAVIVYAVNSTGFCRMTGPSPATIAITDMEAVRSDLHAYAARTGGRFPLSIADLRDALPEMPVWLSSDGRMGRDPWGNAYQYEVGADHQSFRLFSFGADGAPGGRGASADLEVLP